MAAGGWLCVLDQSVDVIVDGGYSVPTLYLKVVKKGPSIDTPKNCIFLLFFLFFPFPSFFVFFLDTLDTVARSSNHRGYLALHLC